MRVFTVLLAVAFVAAEDSNTARWCQTYQVDCPPESKMPFPSNASIWVCVGNFKMTCVDLKTATSSECFPGTATVSTRRGVVPLSQVEIGDDIQDEGNQWTAVLGWLHRDADKVYSAQRINNQLRVSMHHLVKLQDGSFTQARYLRVGMTLSHNITVHSLATEIVKSAYAPYTASGTLMVDGFLVSCYAHVSSHSWAHTYVSAMHRIGLWKGNSLSSWLVVPFHALRRWIE